jgi:hypothetical protein
MTNTGQDGDPELRVRIGVCLLRVERQADHLLITLTTTADISRGVDEVVTLVGTQAAVSRVQEFLASFDDSAEVGPPS